MCYPYLYDVIRCAAEYGIKTNVALSGFGFGKKEYHKLLESGVDGIFVSLNGSSDEINKKSRNGYDLAISALQLLRQEGYPRTTINWVMQASNADDFDNMISIAEKYQVARMIVLSLKPDSENELANVPTKEQMMTVAKKIKTYKGNVQIGVESCFSPMLAILGESFFFGNCNTGEDKGCLAGRMFASINVDGLLSPCRHLYFFEKWNSLSDYWNNSEILNKIRNVEKDVREPCLSCKYGPYCRHCLSINSSIHNDIFIGNEFCFLGKEK